MTTTEMGCKRDNQGHLIDLFPLFACGLQRERSARVCLCLGAISTLGASYVATTSLILRIKSCVGQECWPKILLVHSQVRPAVHWSLQHWRTKLVVIVIVFLHRYGSSSTATLEFIYADSSLCHITMPHTTLSEIRMTDDMHGLGTLDDTV